MNQSAGERLSGGQPVEGQPVEPVTGNKRGEGIILLLLLGSYELWPPVFRSGHARLILSAPVFRRPEDQPQ